MGLWIKMLRVGIAMIEKIEQGIWPISGRGRSFIRCDKCDRTQTIYVPVVSVSGISLTAAVELGWDETETGWLCPFDSDKGATALEKVFKKNL